MKMIFVAFAVLVTVSLCAQNERSLQSIERPATIVLFRTFDLFNFKFSYRLFANDSLIGRISDHEVVVIKTDQHIVSFHASAKAPSLNERSGYLKTKRIAYPITVQPGGVYFVKIGFLKEQLFNYPRQPTVRLIKGNELKKYLKKGFIKRKLKRHLYNEWLREHDLEKYTRIGHTCVPATSSCCNMIGPSTT